MPRGVRKTTPDAQAAANGRAPLETTLDEIRVLLEARRAEYQTSADRISEIVSTLTTPKPRIGRPPLKR